VTAIVIDDHLLRDVRLCKSAVSARGGALTGSWTAERRLELSRSLFVLPDEIAVAPLRQIAFRMAELTERHPLSTLGAEAVAAAEHLDAPLVVWAGDDGPHIRAAAASVGVRYLAVEQ